jgi:hypothetical protein
MESVGRLQDEESPTVGNPPTLREAVRMVASLRGFLGRKCDGEPGTKSLWLGLQRLDDLTAMWKIVTARPSPPNPECAVSSEIVMDDGRVTEALHSQRDQGEDGAS